MSVLAGGVELVLSFMAALGILVLIHEFGHFAMAKLLGVRVETFSVGFGPRLVGWRRGDTDYRVSAIPLGGYVKMTGENPEEPATGDPRELSARPRWQRFLVFVMGALLNIVLAVVLTTAFFYRAGRVIEVPNALPIVGLVAAGSPAEKAGLRMGDRILQVADRDARDSSVLFEEITLSPGTTKEVVVERGGQRIACRLQIGTDPKYGYGEAGMSASVETKGGVTHTVKSVVPGSAAEKAGMRTGDRVVTVNGNKLMSPTDFARFVEQSAGKPLVLGIVRDGGKMDLQVVPEKTASGVRIGIEHTHEFAREAVSLATAFTESLKENRKNAGALFATLKKLLHAEVGLRMMSGPIEIAGVARDAFRGGLDYSLWFLGFFSLQLGVINLLPIPMLDGGHVFILLVEGTLRRDLSAVVKERVMQVGLIFLLVFTGLIIYLDIVKRWFS